MAMNTIPKLKNTSTGKYDLDWEGTENGAFTTSKIIPGTTSEIAAVTTSYSTTVGVGNLFQDITENEIRKWTGSTLTTIEDSGAILVNGLARSAVRVSSGTYNSTKILGFRILVGGTGTLTLSPISGVTDIVITAAEITAMGINAYQDWPIELDSITLGNSDMEVLVYVPA